MEYPKDSWMETSMVTYLEGWTETETVRLKGRRLGLKKASQKQPWLVDCLEMEKAPHSEPRMVG
jgi:hypothetical protein